METNVILFFSAVTMIVTFAIGGIIGWTYKQEVSKPKLVINHPEMFDEEGQYINEELVAVRFIELDDSYYEVDEDEE
jgi:hypothetical protein